MMDGVESKTCRASYKYEIKFSYTVAFFGLLIGRPDSVQEPHGQQSSTYAKPEAAIAVLGS